MTTPDRPADVTELRDALVEDLHQARMHPSQGSRIACGCMMLADALIAAVRADATRAAEVEVAYVNTGSAHDRAMAWSEGHTAGYEEALVPQREQMVAVPVDMGRYTASRYDTDTLHRLHIWNGERSWDIDVPRAALAAQPAAPVTCGDAPIRCTLPAGHDGGHHDNEGGWAALAAQHAAPEAEPVRKPCPDGDNCPDARRWGDVHPKPAPEAEPERLPVVTLRCKTSCGCDGRWPASECSAAPNGCSRCAPR